MADFSKPGRDGEMPGVPAWRDGLGELTRRGLIYSGRGPVTVVECDRTYRIMAGFKQTPERQPTAGDGEAFDYSAAYRRVKVLTEARIDEMRCGHGERLHMRVLGHMWNRLPGDSGLVMAAIVIEPVCVRRANTPGEPAPTADALEVPGGTPQAEFAALASQQTQEFYNDYDLGGSQPDGNPEPVSFSYGEHVEATSEIDYRTLVARAENRAQFHYGVLCSIAGGATEPYATTAPGLVGRV